MKNEKVMGSILERSTRVVAQEFETGRNAIQQKLAEVDWGFQNRGKLPQSKRFTHIPQNLLVTFPAHS